MLLRQPVAEAFGKLRRRLPREQRPQLVRLHTKFLAGLCCCFVQLDETLSLVSSCAVSLTPITLHDCRCRTMSGAIKSADPARLVTLGDMAYSAGSAKQPRCTLADGPTPLRTALVTG